MQQLPDDQNADALVRRNFAFIDLCGFTSLTDEKGVGEAVMALSTFRSVVRERAGWRGVRVAKWLGDGAMLVADPGPCSTPCRMEQALDARARCRCGAASPGRSSSSRATASGGRSTSPPGCATGRPLLLVTASLFDASGGGWHRRLGYEIQGSAPSG